MNDKPFETLDPENWDEMRELAHHMVNDAFHYLQTVADRPEEWFWIYRQQEHWDGEQPAATA